jgi:MoxR-like ATPase
MKIYLRKIDEQCISKQISYPKDILNEFLDGRGEKDTILCEGKTSRYSEEVALLLSTDPRFDNGIKRVLKAEGDFVVGDIMVMYKHKTKYIVELVKISNPKHKSFVSLFVENDRHLLANLDGDIFEELDKINYVKFKKILEWFVNQLNINNNITQGRKTSGQGYKGGSIRELYREWREFGEFTLDCNLVGAFQSSYSKVNYINKTDTGINIRPSFDKTTKEIKHFFIDIFELSESLTEEVLNILNKEYIITSLELFDGLEPNKSIKELFDDYKTVINALSVNKIDYDTYEPLKGGENIILYGVPGSGKSHTIKEEYCSDNRNMERIVFHPDFTYSDFIGQILPKTIGGRVEYNFEPGPFTKILEKAYSNPIEKYYLIIEEINRGNAPAIFGDIFQLLDRDLDGNSQYIITNSDIAKAVFKNENDKIFIPSNMSIIGTMNTSDQNVFTLDTAFQRRWKMRLIKNKFKDTQEENLFANTKILDTDVTWRKFLTEINHIILSKNIRMTSSEDKRLGTHFINIEDLKFSPGKSDQNSRFSEKVLKYLWDDAFKFTKEDIFDLEKVKSLEEVIELFAEATNNERFKVFKENIYNVLISQVNNNS